MLNENVGANESLDGRPFIRTSPGVTGHAVYGPYVTLEPGGYTASFELTAPHLDEVDGDFICAVVDATSDFGQRDIAFNKVTYSDVLAGSPIAIDFHISEPVSNCEFRLWVNGKISLLVADSVSLIRRAEPAKFGFQAGRLGPKATSFIKHCWETDTRITIADDAMSVPLDQFAKFRTQLVDAFKDDLIRSGDRQRLANMVVENVGYRGCGENSLFRAFVGTERPLISEPGRIPFTSSLCHQTHFGYEQYRYWTRALKEDPKYQRKQWEFIFIAQTLYEREFLQPGKKGLVFGAGEEQLPALFASFGVEILATDQSSEAASASGWASSKELTYDVSALNQRGICIDRMFSELVSFRPVDMNAIPSDLNGQFDFCWSACALEHLGSLEHGMTFVKNAMETLKPGGVAVHTTEFNLSSNEDTIESKGLSIYRRRDIEALIDWLTTEGYQIAPIDWDLLGEGFAEMVVDLNPYLARGEPHIRLLIGQYDCTSIGIIIEKPLDWA